MRVLITGTSRGIGKELVNSYLLDEKVEEVIACTSNKEGYNINHPKLVVVELDFLEDNWSVALMEQLGGNPIHILINNSGYLKQSNFSEFEMKDVRKMFDVNFFGPLELIQTLLPNLSKVKGQVINIGSMGGFQGSAKFPGLLGYSSSKAALANMSECMAEELKKHKVNVNCLALGAVNTEMLNQAFPGYEAQVSPKEVAVFVKEFSAHSGKLINGQVLPIASSTPE